MVANRHPPWRWAAWGWRDRGKPLRRRGPGGASAASGIGPRRAPAPSPRSKAPAASTRSKAKAASWRSGSERTVPAAGVGDGHGRRRRRPGGRPQATTPSFFSRCIRRDFFRAAPGSLARFADRFVGSPEIFGHEQREPEQSVNFVACHDGFTLNDLVSYDRKHNEANGENNRDGGDDNKSWNCGAEGPSDDSAVEALRKSDLARKVFGDLLVAVTAGIAMHEHEYCTLRVSDIEREFRRVQPGANRRQVRAPLEAVELLEPLDRIALDAGPQRLTRDGVQVDEPLGTQRRVERLDAARVASR